MSMPSRRVRALSLACLLVACASAPATRAQSSTAAPSAGKALLADFVEVSSRQALRSDAALIELVNMSDIALDVRIGEGATSLKPGERMLAGVQPGLVAVKVMGRDVPTGALEGDLEIAGGRHYELAFAYDTPPPEPSVAASAAGEAKAGDGGSMMTAEPAASGKPAPVKASPAPGGKTTKSGKVQIGRKRS